MSALAGHIGERVDVLVSDAIDDCFVVTLRPNDVDTAPLTFEISFVEAAELAGALTQLLAAQLLEQLAAVAAADRARAWMKQSVN